MLFLAPIAFLPVVVDSFSTGKNLVLMGMAMLGLVLWGIDFVVSKKSEIKYNYVLPWLLLLTVYAWLGWWFRLSVGARMRSFLDVGGVGTMTFALVWMFLWLQIGSREEKKISLNWLSASAIVVIVLSIVTFIYPASKMPITWPKDNPLISIGSAWSLTGSLLNEAILVAFLAIEWGKRLLVKLKSSAEQNDSYISEAVMTSLMTLGTLLSVFRLFKSGLVNLDNSSAWVIAAEVFKRSPFWGVGIGDFASAFAHFRPVEYNLTSFWASGFKFSSMGVLQLWTELGTVGLAMVFLVFLGFLRQKKNYDFFRMLILGVAVAVAPFSFVGVLLLVWILAVSVFETKRMSVVLKVGDDGFNAGPWIFSGITMVGVVFGSYWLYRVVGAEIIMRQSLLAASKNNGGETYNLQIRAIGMLPTMAEYRRVYSQTNLSLASVILANKEMTDEDKQKASVLVQQAVREGKAAISLEEGNPSYWVNLAAIYRQIVGVVDGAADWSYQAYQQAVAIEPVNPMSRLDMGGLLFAAGKYDEADRAFEAVVMSKNDLANGWYNWAHSAKKLNKLPEAVGRLTQAIALVPVDSGDYEQANKELTEWKKELEALTKKQAEQTTKPAETLETPKPLPTGSAGVIPVPSGADLNPPSVSPIPTAQVSATPTVAPTSSPTVTPKQP